MQRKRENVNVRLYIYTYVNCVERMYDDFYQRPDDVETEHLNQKIYLAQTFTHRRSVVVTYTPSEMRKSACSQHTAHTIALRAKQTHTYVLASQLEQRTSFRRHLSTAQKKNLAMHTRLRFVHCVFDFSSTSFMSKPHKVPFID